MPDPTPAAQPNAQAALADLKAANAARTEAQAIIASLIAPYAYFIPADIMAKITTAQDDDAAAANKVADATAKVEAILAGAS